MRRNSHISRPIGHKNKIFKNTHYFKNIFMFSPESGETNNAESTAANTLSK